MKNKNNVKAEIDKADIIHSFIPQARTLKEQADGVGLHWNYKTKTWKSQGSQEIKTNEEYSYNQIIGEARRIMDKANH